MTGVKSTARLADAVGIINARKAYGANQVLDGIDLTIAKGTVTVILGPSGSGKSTLLRAINHLERLDLGYVSVDGEPIGVRFQGDRLKELPERVILQQRTRIGFVFQNFNLFPHLTVLQNITEAPIAHKRKTPAEAELAGPGPVGAGGAVGQGIGLPASALGRAAAAGRDRQGSGDGTGTRSLRRADVRSRSGTGR